MSDGTINERSMFGVYTPYKRRQALEVSASRKGPAQTRNLKTNISQAFHKSEESHTCSVSCIVGTIVQNEGSIRMEDTISKGI